MKYRSAWYSPRNFANEGSYIFGTIEEMSAFFHRYISGDSDSGWSLIKHHRTLKGAADRCERDARRDIKTYRRQSTITSINFGRVEEFTS